MNKINNKKTKKLKIFKYLIYILIFSCCIFSSLNNTTGIISKKNEKELLLKELETLKAEEKILSDDVEKLKNPEYAARYAREKYLYSKNGEKILKID